MIPIGAANINLISIGKFKVGDVKKDIGAKATSNKNKRAANNVFKTSVILKSEGCASPPPSPWPAIKTLFGIEALKSLV